MLTFSIRLGWHIPKINRRILFPYFINAHISNKTCLFILSYKVQAHCYSPARGPSLFLERHQLVETRHTIPLYLPIENTATHIGHLHHQQNSPHDTRLSLYWAWFIYTLALSFFLRQLRAVSLHAPQMRIISISPYLTWYRDVIAF